MPDVTLESGHTHTEADTACCECWGDYPLVCRLCGGLVHAEFGDENWDGDYWLFTRCDNCGAKDTR